MRVLFACSQNSIRSPMAEVLLRHFSNQKIDVSSAGLINDPVHPFAIATMAEFGCDLEDHPGHTLEEVDLTSFDVVVGLSPEIKEHLEKLPNFEYWNVPEPLLLEGNRDMVLEEFRKIRDILAAQIQARFSI